MFNDIINIYKIDLDDYISDPRCPKCNEKNLIKKSGTLIGGKKFVQKIVCSACNYSFRVIYDEKLDIIDIQF